jgi:hypothetical protein
MNKVYKSVWNESVGAWVAVSENSPARGKKSSGRARTLLGLSAIALASASLGLPSTATLAAENRAALFNDFTDGSCTAIYDGDTQHGTSLYTGAGCNPRLGNSGSATSIGLNGGGTNGTNLIPNQSGAFINGGLEVFGSNVASGSPAAYIHGGLSLFSDGTTSGTANKLIGVAAGTQTNDATNVGQLKPLASAFGGNTALNADGSVTAPSYTLKGSTYHTVGDALTALGDSSGKYFHVNSTNADSSATGTNATAIGAESVSSGLNTTAIGYQAVSSGPNESIAIGSQVQSTASGS